MSNLWTIIPAAGESKRFKEFGYQTPKPLLRLKSKSGETGYMVQHVISDLSSWIRAGVIIALHEGVDKLQDLEERVMFVSQTTGQADTVYQIVKTLPDNDNVLILDCDMVLLTTDILLLIKMIQIYDVSIAVAETFDPNSSRVDQIPFPTRFVEKENISQYGIVGARCFKNARLLTIALKRTLEKCEDRHIEPYLSLAINPYPGIKFAHLITEYVDLGTPQRIMEAGWEIL